MKVATRIKISYYIDGFIFCIPMAVFVLILKDHLPWLAVIFVVLLALAYIFSPLIFGNASPGMTIMGLVIVDKDYKNPGAKAIIKRQLLMPYAAFRGGLNFMFYDDDYSVWELKYLKTMTVLEEEEKN